MIDERVLADPTRCPSCAAVLSGTREACPGCGLPLTGPTAGRLWQVCVEAAALLQERAQLVQALRAQGVAPAYAAPLAPSVLPGGTAAGQPTPPAPTPPAPTPPAPTPPAPTPPAPTPPAPAMQRPEWTPRRVQNLLLALGVGLLAVAAVIFVAVSWGRLGVGGRAAVMTGVTALAATGAYRVSRRGLTSTAEALSLLTVGLALLDCAGAWASDLAGLRDRPGLVVAAGSVAVVAVLAGAGSHVLRTRALRTSSALLAQLAVPLVAAHLADGADHPAALWSALLAAQAVAVVAVVAGWAGGRDTRDARGVLAVGAVVTAAASTATALVAAYAEDGSLVVGTAVLLVVAAGTAVSAELLRERYHDAAVTLTGLAAALTVAAAWAPAVEAAPGRWTPPVLAGVALVLLAASRAVPSGRRGPAAAVLLTAAWLPALGAVPALAAAVLGRVQWPDHVWSGTGTSARDLLLSPSADPLQPGVQHWAPGTAAMLAVSAAALVAPLVWARLARVRAVGVPALLAAVLPLAVAADLPYAGALTLDVLAAAAGLAAGIVLLRRAASRVESAAAAAAGLVIAGLVACWSLAVPAATLSVLPAVAAMLALAVLATHGEARLRTVRVAGAAATVLLLVAEAAAAARHAGAGEPAVWSVAFALVLAAAVAALALLIARAPGSPFWAGVAELLTLVAVAASVLTVASVTWWRGAGPAGVGLAAAVTVALLLAGTTVPAPARLRHATTSVRTLLAAAGLLALGASAWDADRLWLALLAVGAGTAVLGVREDHRFGWLAGVLLAASSWVRLAISEVDAPEAYTVPTAVALLVVGWRRRAADPAYRSWSAYAPGLLLALVPSLLRAVSDAGDLRPFLLGLAALAVVAVGVSRRLQAPLLIGGSVLALDAVVQLAPYLSAVYEAVPRWVTIGAVGLLLLAAGATYEQRVRDLRRVGERVARFG